MLSCVSCVQLFATLWTLAPGLLYPWDSPSKNIGVSCHALLQGIFLTQGLNPRLLSPALAGGLFTTSTTWEAQAAGQCSQSEIMLPLGICSSVWRNAAEHHQYLIQRTIWPQLSTWGGEKTRICSISTCTGNTHGCSCNAGSESSGPGGPSYSENQKNLLGDADATGLNLWTPFWVARLWTCASQG